MKKKTLLVAGVGLAVGGLLASVGISNAFWGGDVETHNQLQEAMENKDYDSWKQVHGDMPRITDYITCFHIYIFRHHIKDPTFWFDS